MGGRPRPRHGGGGPWGKNRRDTPWLPLVAKQEIAWQTLPSCPQYSQKPWLLHWCMRSASDNARNRSQEPNALKVNTSESAGCLSAPACILERVCTTAKASEVVQPKHQYLHTSQPLATVVKWLAWWYQISCSQQFSFSLFLCVCSQ